MDVEEIKAELKTRFGWRWGKDGLTNKEYALIQDVADIVSNRLEKLSYASPASQGVQNGGQDKDITNECEYGSVYGESLPLLSCACGKRFESWDFILSIYPDMPKECDCGRKLYYKQDIKIMEVQ